MQPYCHYCAREFPLYPMDTTQHVLPIGNNMLAACRRLGKPSSVVPGAIELHSRGKVRTSFSHGSTGDYWDQALACADVTPIKAKRSHHNKEHEAAKRKKVSAAGLKPARGPIARTVRRPPPNSRLSASSRAPKSRASRIPPRRRKSVA